MPRITMNTIPASANSFVHVLITGFNDIKIHRVFLRSGRVVGDSEIDNFWTYEEKSNCRFLHYAPLRSE